MSETTIRYTAQSGIVPWILVANPPDFQRLCHVYQDVAATAGRKLRLGESVGAFRAVHFGNTEAEAVALLRDTNYAGFQNLASGSGRRFGPPRTRRSTRSIHTRSWRPRNGQSTACAG